MKKLLILLSFILATIASFGQFINITTQGSNTTLGTDKGGRRPDSALIISPQIFADTAAANYSVVSKYSGTLIQVSGNQIWHRTLNPAQWHLFATSSGGSYVLVSDTSVMLTPYLRKSDTLSMLSNRLRISDTAFMLSTRVKYSDTANQMSGYVRKNFPVLYTDTALMLSGYAKSANVPNNQRSIATTYPLQGGGDFSINRTHSIDTGRSVPQIVTGGDLNKVRDSLQANITASVAGVSSVSITTANGVSGSVLSPTTTPAITLTLGAITPSSVSSSGAITATYFSGSGLLLTNVIHPSDTASMLANRLKISDTAYMVSNRLKISDTLTMLSPYAHSQAVVKYYDTASMLSTRLKVSDTAYMVSNRLKISDTLTMLSNRLKISDTTTMLSGYLRTGNAKVGTVTSVGLVAPSFLTISNSPITSSGNITATLSNQTANTIFSGPTTGSPAQPTFRSLVRADIPNIYTLYTDTAAMLSGFLTKGDSTIYYPYVSNPLNYDSAYSIRYKGNFTWAGASLNARCVINNGYLYVCEYSNNKIAIFDIGNPVLPVLVSETPTGLNPRDVKIFNNLMYVVCYGANKIEVYDISNPGFGGSKISEVTTNNGPKMMTIVGKYGYVICNSSSTLQKINLSVTIPLVVSTVSTSSGPLGISYSNQLLSVVGQSQNLDIFSEVSLIKNTVNIGKSSAKSTNEFIGNYILVTDRDSSYLQVIKINSVVDAAVVYNISTAVNPEQVLIKDNVAYVASLTNSPTHGSIDAFDIKNINAIARIKNVAVTSSGTGFLAAAGNYLYSTGHFSPYNIDVLQIPKSGYDGRYDRNPQSFYDSTHLDIYATHTMDSLLKMRVLYTDTSAILINYPRKDGTRATGTWNISITGNSATVTNGVYTIGNQSIAGDKTFTNLITNSVGITTTSQLSLNNTAGGGTTNTHAGSFAGISYLFNNYYYNGLQTFDDNTKASSGLQFNGGTILLQVGAANVVPSTIATINSTGLTLGSNSITAGAAIFQGTVAETNSVNIPAAGSNSLTAINTATDVGTALTAGAVVSGSYGELDYTSTSSRTIGSSNLNGAGVFLAKPTISGSSTITMTQGGGGIRAMSALTGLFYEPSTAASTSTITHAAGLRSYLYSDNVANLYTITNYYGVLVGSSTEFAPTNITNRYGIYQEGTSDKNVLNGVTTLGNPLTLKGYTVATLPTGVQGYTAYVTDALAPTFGATVVGGGSVVTPVFYNGTNWVSY